MIKKIYFTFVFFAIFLLVNSTISISYNSGKILNHERKDEKSNIVIEKIKRANEKILKYFFGNNFVSAFDLRDLVGDPQDILREIQSIQESFKRTKIQDPNTPPEQKAGTCQDIKEGICTFLARKDLCEKDYDEDGVPDGKWFNDPNGNVAECIKGCCIIGNQPIFTTELNCKRIAESKGLNFGSGEKAYFDANLKSEVACMLMAVYAEEGACIIGESQEFPGKKECKRTTREECTSLNGEFHLQTLCSKQELNTVCLAQNYTSCVEGEDEVFWFDSCGNKENIFGSVPPSEREGMFLKKNESCLIGNPGNWLENQETCGNCQRELGSVCANRSEVQGKTLRDANGNTPPGDGICKDLRCKEIDQFGIERIRENGETWCSYQNDFGTAGISDITNLLDYLGRDSLSYSDDESTRNFQVNLPLEEILETIGLNNPLANLITAGGGSSIGPPGSLFYRKSCVDGKIEMTACENYRNEICVEHRERKKGTSGTFSTAACRKNRWQECLKYNPTTKSGGALGRVQVLMAMVKCQADPDCFVKVVNVDKDFRFPVCLPKYPPGFAISQESKGGNEVCSFASQTCPTAWVKKTKTFGITAYWSCEANCDCMEGDSPDNAKPSRKFIEQMNSFCNSLGDCGKKPNYQGMGGTNGYKLYTCVTKDLEGDCKNKKPVMGGASLLGSFITGAFGGMNVNAKPGKYIEAATENQLKKSIGSSTNLLDIGSIFGLDLGSLGEDGSAEEGGGQIWTGGIPEPGGYSGRELPWIGGISGASALATYAGVKAGWFPSLSTALPPSAPVMNAMGGAITGSAIALAATSLIIGLSGIGRGLGPGQSYALMGLSTVGGGLIGAGVTAGQSAAAPTLTAIGIVIIAVVVFLTVMSFINDVGEVKRADMIFECKPWQPPRGGAACEKCGQDSAGKDSAGNEMKYPCNEYACSALGSTCKLVGGDPDVICIDINPNDFRGPIIQPDESVKSENVIYQPLERGNGFKVRKTSGEPCITQFEAVTFGIKLDEYGTCGIGDNPRASLEEMFQLGDTSSLSKNFTQVINSLDILNFLEENPAPGTKVDVNFYIKCEDATGNPSQGDFIVNFCLLYSDLTAPFIWNVGPDPTNVYLPYEATSGQIRVRVSEPAELRWSYEDVPFDQMTNTLTCQGGSSIQDCIANVELRGEETVIYVRGRDREGNTNQESVRIVIRRTENPLRVVNLRPNETITVGTPVASIMLHAETFGGVDGTALCFYSLDKEIFIPFARTETTNIHESPEERRNEGLHTLDVNCIDRAGNKASNSTTFIIRKDLTPPEVTRVYDAGGTMVVYTNEPSTCYYKVFRSEEEGSCVYSLDSAIAMRKDDSENTVHVIENFNRESFYNIKCKDNYGNVPTRCNIIVRGSLL